MQVIEFIEQFKDYSEVPFSMERLFRNGYCYYFAALLKEAFNRGQICWCAPYSHIVWLDDDGIAYDIEGQNVSDCIAYIPIEYLGEAGIDSFKKMNNFVFNPSKEDITGYIEKYYSDNNKVFDKHELDYFYNK